MSAFQANQEMGEALDRISHASGNLGERLLEFTLRHYVALTVGGCAIGLAFDLSNG